MTESEKIRAEVKRLRKLHQLKYQQLDTEDKMCLVECGKRNLCNDLLDFIDSLPEEPVSEDFEEALSIEWKAYNDRGAATVDALEDNTQELAFAKGFYYGAQWHKEKVMNDAIDAEVGQGKNLIIPTLNYTLDSMELNPGDKVKIIIVKEEEK